MPGRSASEREALANQNAAIMAVFERAGFSQIAPDIIQPADIFLERSGEDIRARTFVFNDPDSNELCLRPDLTVPACRFHLSHAPASEARYCYLGTVFRYPDEALSPQEFNQAGIEWFGGNDPIIEEARILKLAISALDAAGLTGLKVTIGDLGLFNGLIEDMPMPERWKRRLRHQFWRPEAFRKLLQDFSSPVNGMRSSISPVIDVMGKRNAVTVAQETLAAGGYPLVTERTVEDIASRLAEKHADRSEKPLSAIAVAAIENYLAIEGPATDVVTSLSNIGRSPEYDSAIERYVKRIAGLENQGLSAQRFHFDANFGRELEYYTGFVFQIEANAGNHPVVVAGGGRYDDLLKDLGARARIPAVGCAIHTERVKAVLG